LGSNKQIRMKWILITLLLLTSKYALIARSLHVGSNHSFKTIKAALEKTENGDTVFIHKGLYKEGNIIVNRSITLFGIDRPILDGDKKYEVLSVKTSYVTIQGLRVQHSGYASLDDPGGIKVYDATRVTIIDNELYDNFFGIYIQFSTHCLVKNNKIIAFGKEEQTIGNGIHCWKSDSLQIIGNSMKGCRDGIYFEFVNNSVIWRNTVTDNIRYGLHFMNSNNDAYFTNIFSRNGAGVAVMFSKKITMMNNTFNENWGDAAYGILLKEISDCHLSGNTFNKNTAAIFMDGCNRTIVEKNAFSNNGWGLKIQANCMDNTIQSNNFFKNTFDVSTNGTLLLNKFQYNYWDKYTGYDLNKDKIGDVPYRPLSLYSVIVENNPTAMLLYRSLIVTLLDQSEKKIPSLTPENFIDEKPLMNLLKL
jgi:nitrous oxidase accessory protein